MISKNTYQILIWIIVILAATTVSMGVSFWYHKQEDKRADRKMNESTIEMPAQQRTRFFKEQLDLQPDQIDVFRELNRKYNRVARSITMELEELRVSMVNELGMENPDETKLNEISTAIGRLHSELKQETISYYLDMKRECNPGQQQKLNDLFMSALKSKENVRLPQRGRGPGGNSNR